MNVRLYLIIGGDGLEYGPVSDVEVRQWIIHGRATGHTAVQIEGTTAWLTVKDLPEFADALSVQAEALASLPSEVRLSLPDGESTFHTRAGALDLTSCFTRSWNLVRQNPLLLIGSSSLIFLIHVALAFIPMIGFLLLAAFGLPIWGGLYWLFLRLIRGETASFQDALGGFQIAFYQLTLGGLTASVIILLGLFLCVLPGLYLIVAWLGFGPLLILDRKLNFGSAFDLSRRIVNANWWTLFALFIASFVIAIGGLLVVGIGFALALPVAIGATVYAYQDIFGSPPLDES